MTKKPNQLITEIEKQIANIQQIIDNWKQEIISHENILSQSIKQLSQIKENMKLENNENNTFGGVNNK